MVQPAPKKPRYPANPDAPKFTPEVWIAEGSKTDKQPDGLAVSSNCYQYAIAGSASNGSNVVYDESIPNPGLTKGEVITVNSFNSAAIRRLIAEDGLEAASLNHNRLPVNKPGKYVVGVYVKNLRSKKNPDGRQDYHLLRQDADGGWSEKEGWNNQALVQRYAEPAEDGGYRTLPEKYGSNNNYRFVAYAYVPKEGIDAGVESFLIPAILAHRANEGDGCAMPDAYFEIITRGKHASAQDEVIESVKAVGETMKKFGITGVADVYEACRQQFRLNHLKRPELLTPTPAWP